MRSTRVAAAFANAMVSLSFTVAAVLQDSGSIYHFESNNVILKKTFDPSFHIFVTIVSPGYTTPTSLASHSDREGSERQTRSSPELDILIWSISREDVLASNARCTKSM